LLHTAVGRIEQQDGVVYIVTNEGEAGCVVFGPYTELQPGSYEVEFHVMPQEMGNRTCCVVDVLRRARTIAAEKDFTASELVFRNGIIPVRFEVIEKDIFEFRLTSTGVTGLKVRYQRPVRFVSPPP
jgi:hypothetical protein